ncbi:MAG: hypothetical protein IEMM0002_0309 [bacterium]|nr:MAG: hypothetical protein IEMM0002_0309 [bacterium]
MEKLRLIFDENRLHHHTAKWLEKAVAGSFFPKRAKINFERFIERVIEVNQPLLKNMNKRNIPWMSVLFSGSQALADMVIKNPGWLFWALQPSVLHSTRFKRDMRRERKAILRSLVNDPKDAFCDFKNRELIRIGWRDLLKLADTVETLEDLSRLADVCIESALEKAEKTMTDRFGRPILENGETAKFIIIGMGKLGGRELNFSSDIDLIYICDDDNGETEGGVGPNNMERPMISIKEYFSRLAQNITSLLNDIGPHGNVYRVDLGLRPEGSLGPLVCSMSYAELYYESWGQPWEKQAMIKARICAGDETLGDGFLEMIRLFIYRKSLDFSALKEIQQMKEKIDLELKTGRDKYKNNVKLGKGGIREIEFIIQAYQLIYGGKMPWLAETNSLKALHRIFERGLIGYAEYAALADALLFLRDLENRMQITYGRQVQILPQDDELEVLALKMALPDSDTLMREFDRIISGVSVIFQAFFGEDAEEAAGEKSDFHIDLDNEESALLRLREMRFADPSAALASLRHIRDGEPFSHPSTKSRRMFTRLFPEMLKLTAQLPRKNHTLNNLDKFFSNLTQREGVYELLTDHPPAREVLIHLFTYTQNLADAMINHPDVIDILGSGTSSIRLRPLEKVPGTIKSYNEKLDWLRKDRNSESIRIGISYLMSHNNPFALMRQLSDLADDFLEVSLKIIGEETRRKENIPQKFDQKKDKEPKLAVIGLGKLGRRELNYGSDLDLMFVYDPGEEKPDGIDYAGYYTKLCRKLLNAVGGISKYGFAYKVDTRLRPEGEKGPIIITADAARSYYEKRGALWERMALCGARPVAGNVTFCGEFLRSLDRFVYGGSLTGKDEEWINAMKRKIQKERIKKRKKIAIKYGRGGIVDIEFLAQKLKLTHGGALPHIRSRNTLEILESIEKEGWPVPDPSALVKTYRLLRTVETHLRMETGRGVESLPDKAEQLRKLEDIFAPFIKLSRPLADGVVEAMERAQASIYHTA